MREVACIECVVPMLIKKKMPLNQVDAENQLLKSPQ